MVGRNVTPRSALAYHGTQLVVSLGSRFGWGEDLIGRRLQTFWRTVPLVPGSSRQSPLFLTRIG
jgi:hypothetical protein